MVSREVNMVSMPVHSALSAICLYIVNIYRVTSEPCCPLVAQKGISVCRQRTYMPDRACCAPDKEFVHAREYFCLPGREFVWQTEHAGYQKKLFSWPDKISACQPKPLCSKQDMYVRRIKQLCMLECSYVCQTDNVPRASWSFLERARASWKSLWEIW